MKRRRVLAAVAGLVALAAGATLIPNTRGLSLVDVPGRAVAVTTTGPWASMIYLARTDSGILAIDLGWFGSARALDAGLRRLGATRADVRWVFITHAHRDHIAAWPLVRQARFVVGAGDVPVLLGTAPPMGAVAALAERISGIAHPVPGELAVTPVTADTTFPLGADTVRAFPIPGHTPGSVAYVVRGILFAGDAMNWRPVVGFRGAAPEMSGDVAQSRASMRALLARLTARDARIACSAHAKCAPLDSSLRTLLTR